MNFNLKRLLLPLCLALLSFGVVTAIKNSQESQPKVKTKVAGDVKSQEKKKPKPKPVIPVEEAYPYKVTKNFTLYEYLRKLEVPPTTIIAVANASKKVKNLSRLRPGHRFQVFQDEDKDLTSIEFWFSHLESLKVFKNTEGLWEAQLVIEEIDTETKTFAGEVKTTLWESALGAKMDPVLIINLAEIFGWEIDFSREVQVGDRWRITVEHQFVKGRAIGWGAILAAEYENLNGSNRAVLFQHGDEVKGYYNPQGGSLRKMFLKSPLRFGRVTSHFNRRRFHPKLKVIRPHNGVDYGAPIGTPVLSVADGRVTFSRYSGGGGNVLKIRHNSTYQTAYKHLRRFAKGIRPGVRVKQGQVVAYVGNTGLSTGPHLHYEFFVNGRFVDPLRQKFPSADPVEPELMDEFKRQAKVLLASLPSWDGDEPIEKDILPQQNWAHDLLLPEVNDQQLIYREPTRVN